MILTAKHMTYFSVLEAMQNIDSNVTWFELSGELKSGDASLSQVKEICKETLERWLEEDDCSSIRNLLNCL